MLKTFGDGAVMLHFSDSVQCITSSYELWAVSRGGRFRLVNACAQERDCGWVSDTMPPYPFRKIKGARLAPRLYLRSPRISYVRANNAGRKTGNKIGKWEMELQNGNVISKWKLEIGSTAPLGHGTLCCMGLLVTTLVASGRGEERSRGVCTITGSTTAAVRLE